MGDDDRACPACGSVGVHDVGSIEGYRRGSTFTIAECPSCRSQYAVDPVIPDGLYEAIYTQGRRLPGYHRYWGYADAAQHLRWPLHYLACSEEMYWGVEQVLRRRTRAGLSSNVLEVGSGLGYLTAAIRASGRTATGVDLAALAVEDARARYGPWYEMRDATKAAERGERYDVVVALEIIEHLSDPLVFLEPLIAALEPSGELIISTPNKSRHPGSTLWQTELPPVHVHWFTEAGLEALVARAGGEAELLDLSEFNEIAPRLPSPVSAPAPPPTPVLDEHDQPLQLRPEATLPSLRDRALRYPLTSPLTKVVRRVRFRGRPSVDPSRANSLVAVIRRSD